MVNYQNGKIYMIESIEGKCRYYGSTCEKLSQRMTKHRYAYNHNKNKSSGKVMMYPDAKIYLVLKYPCKDKEELTAKEGEYIRQNECVNKQIPGRTRKEYYEDNKEYLKEMCKKNREKNIVEYTKKAKQYYLKNRDEKLKQFKVYRENPENKKKQKEYMKEYQKIKYHCECGSICARADKSKHFKTKKHLKFIEQQ